uniref:DUF4939 domain-containing protein n=1 Tax=Podarcis muralis TaxID=64176 RepID=A0A670JYY4_PODMU
MRLRHCSSVWTPYRLLGPTPRLLASTQWPCLRNLMGPPASFPMFLAQAKLYIQGRARNFLDDRTKVHFLISLLKDQAAKWALPLLRQDSPLLTDYGGFCNLLEAALWEQRRCGGSALPSP